MEENICNWNSEPQAVQRISVNGKGAAAQNTGTARVPLKKYASVGPTPLWLFCDTSRNWKYEPDFETVMPKKQEIKPN